MDRKIKLNLIAPEITDIPISRQAELLEISRSSYYYQPMIDEENICVMNLIDKIYTDYPFYGFRRITAELVGSYQKQVNRKRVQRLMRLMGIEAIYPKPKPNLSQNCFLNKTYPYLLKDCQITRPNQVWGTDITYIKLEKGWAYLTAILDWFSRYVISWKLSETLESDFCVDNLQNALEINLPEIHNSDQGVQFTDKNYTGMLEEKEIKISMDGRGRCMNNIFTERLWRTVKYENVFLRSYHDINDAKAGLKDYFKFYNAKRRHQSLDYQTPESVYNNR